MQKKITCQREFYLYIQTLEIYNLFIIGRQDALPYLFIVSVRNLNVMIFKCKKHIEEGFIVFRIACYKRQRGHTIVKYYSYLLPTDKK